MIAVKQHPEVSIVMTYYERLPQLILTLDSIQAFNPSSLEVVIVDDGSVIEPIPENLAGRYSFDIRVVRRTGKKMPNPCVMFNLGFAVARGSKVIIQNAECLHATDVVSAVKKNLSDANYLSFGCYSLSKSRTLDLWLNPAAFLGNPEIKNRPVTFDGDEGWYNHTQYRALAYHFAAAITAKNLKKLGGFDPRYADGAAWDDNEFVIRVKRLGLRIEIIDSEYVFHQWHYWLPKEACSSIPDNQALFESVTMKEKHVLPTRFSLPFLKYLLKNRTNGKSGTEFRVRPGIVLSISSLSPEWIAAFFRLFATARHSKIVVLVPPQLAKTLFDIQTYYRNVFILEEAQKEQLLSRMSLISSSGYIYVDDLKLLESVALSVR